MARLLTRAIRRFGRGIRYAFGYDAVTDTKRRRLVTPMLRSEDEEQTSADRRQLVASARDLDRNFEVAAWAIRKHLDYVSSFSFQARTGDDKLNQRLEELIEWWERPANFDVAGRHGRSRFLRLAEARRTVDGDLGLLKLADGRLQAIEGDRIKNPGGVAIANWRHGVKTTAEGRAVAYAIHSRTPFGLSFEKTVPAGSMALHGYFSRFDQVRGVGLITPSLNRFRDLYENFDYALAKAKISQLFGLITKHDAEEPLGVVSETSESETGAQKFEVDFGRGPFHLDLATTEDAEFLETKTPAAEFKDFTFWMVLVALKALDIPYSFFCENFTNFYGSRGGLIQYLQSCKSKRRDNVALLDALTRWRLALFIADGYLELPSKLTLPALRFQWIPDGVPWWNPTQEAKGALMLMQAGLTTPQRVCMETGSDFFENVDQLAEAIAYAEEKGVPISFASEGGKEKQYAVSE